MSSSPSPDKKIKLCSEKQIGDLADADLAAIFERLPPYDRLIASEVCRRWHGLGRKAWLDVKHLDLTPFSEHYMGATAIRLCPNLQSVIACEKTFNQNELACLTRSSNLSSVKLYDCNFAIPDMPGGFANTFRESLEDASWSELIFHGAYLAPEWFFSCAYLPASLLRLQLSSLRLRKATRPWAELLVNALGRLQNLECFILQCTPDFEPTDDDLACCTLRFGNPFIAEKICAMKNLKELCIGPVLDLIWDLSRILASLRKLEVLCISNFHGCDSKIAMAELFTTNSVLRILILAGKIYMPHKLIAQALPARERVPRGSPPPLPLLHVFVCKEAAENFCFDASPSQKAIVYPINEPMPQFLEREDIAPIFEGVWMAERIKEAAKNGGKLWNYEVEDTAKFGLINAHLNAGR